MVAVREEQHHGRLRHAELGGKDSGRDDSHDDDPQADPTKFVEDVVVAIEESVDQGLVFGLE